MDNSPLAIKEEVVDTTDLIFEEHENDSTGDQTGDQTEAHTEAQPEDQIEIKIEEENALSDDKFVEVHEAKSDSDTGSEMDPFADTENHETKDVENKIKTIEVYRCQTCGIGYSKNGDLKYHKGLEHTKQCYVCEQEFDSKNDFRRHFAKHEGWSKEGKPVNEKVLVKIVKAPQKPCKCNFCDAEYGDEGSLQSHRKNAHQMDPEQEKKIENESREKALARNVVECAYCKVKMPKESMPLHLGICDAKVRFTHRYTSK